MITDCPHCDSKVDCEEKGYVDLGTELKGIPSKAVLLECKICHSPLFGFSDLIPVGENEWDWDNADRRWPAPETEIDWSIPEIARNSLIEAKQCFKANAFSACAVMCGRTIEGVCKHHDAKTKTLDAGLKKLRDDGMIDDRIFEWGDALRQHRNLGAHATTKRVAKEDARDLLDFCIAICEYIFVLNEKFQRFQQRQAKL